MHPRHVPTIGSTFTVACWTKAPLTGGRLGPEPQRIVELFRQVDAELHTLTDRHCDIMIAGGAAVALLWNQQRITNDVDIVSEGMTPQLREAVARVARDYDLAPDWFNDAAKLKLRPLRLSVP